MERDVKVDMHCHSIYYNDGRHPVEEILIHARKIGLGGIVITDHNEVKGSLKAYRLAREMDIIVIRGTEVSSAEGHILAYGVEEVVPRQRSAA